MSDKIKIGGDCKHGVATLAGMRCLECEEESSLAPVTGSASGFWRSAHGENHGRNSVPGDEWVTAGEATDTDRLRWTVEHFDDYDWANLPEDLGQARQYIDSQMMKQNDRANPTGGVE